MDDISTLLREIKAASALTEVQLAAELGTTQPTVNRIINGQSSCNIALYRAIVAMHAARCAPTSAHPPPSPSGQLVALTG
jgi:transcriptional regulator with XRE-family HTH domain